MVNHPHLVPQQALYQGYSSSLIYYNNNKYADSNLLHLLKDEDLKQMRFVFNSIDIDQDGQLSLSEMRKFASEIRSVRLSH